MKSEFAVLFILLCSALYPPTVAGEGIFDLPPIQVTQATSLTQWGRQFDGRVAQLRASATYPEEGYSECREVEEVSGAFLCQFNQLVEMNTALARVSLFAGGTFGNPVGTVPGNADPGYERARTSVGGHDLTSGDLRQFYAKVAEQCPGDSQKCLNASERTFYDGLSPLLRRAQDMVVITFARKAPISPVYVVSHEILHAQYFLQPEFRREADGFWASSVTAADKALTKTQLSPYYDAANEFLVKNEFQAYVLMSGAESNLLGALARKYRDPFLRAMRDHGLEPIQVAQ